MKWQTREFYIEKFEGHPEISNEKPDEGFMDFYKKNKGRLNDFILKVKENDLNLKKFNMRAGLAFPLAAIINEEIKELCSIPFRRKDGRVFACEGAVENWKGCPPHSDAVCDTIQTLKKSRAFLIMQFEGINDTVYQKYIHHFTLRVEKELKENGYAVNACYSCGPCRICAECNTQGDCRLPQKRRFALEACGFWVNRLCRAAGEYPVLGEGEWAITWVKDWHLPTQTPSAYKSVTGIVIGEINEKENTNEG